MTEWSEPLNVDNKLSNKYVGVSNGKNTSEI